MRFPTDVCPTANHRLRLMEVARLLTLLERTTLESKPQPACVRELRRSQAVCS